MLPNLAAIVTEYLGWPRAAARLWPELVARAGPAGDETAEARELAEESKALGGDLAEIGDVAGLVALQQAHLAPDPGCILLCAARSGQFTAMSFALGAGAANIEASLFVAMDWSRVAAVQFLYEMVLPNRRPDVAGKVLRDAAELGLQAMVEWAFDACEAVGALTRVSRYMFIGECALYTAIRHQRDGVVRFLLDRGVAVTRWALEAAAESRRPDLAMHLLARPISGKLKISEALRQAAAEGQRARTRKLLISGGLEFAASREPRLRWYNVSTTARELAKKLADCIESAP